MAGGDILLDDQELEFLLQNAEPEGEEKTAAGELQQYEQYRAAKITIRGELDKISLSDIFQTLSMSKMEGILRVHNSLESRDIFFHEGVIRYSFPARSETKRIGQRLIRCGLINSDQLRSALVTQKKEYAPVGQILINEGLVTQEQIDQVLDYQLEEDLYDLFTWKVGQFEFYKGKLEDPALIERFERAPQFDVSSILLEVARRSDEWTEILGQIGSVDEIPIFPEGIEFPEMSGDELAFCEAIDESSSVRECADVAMLSLFDGAKAACELSRKQLIEFAPAPMLIALARDAMQGGDVKRCMLLAQVSASHADELDAEVVGDLGDVLRSCGDPKFGARTLLGCAHQLDDPAVRLDVGLRARHLDRNSLEVLRFVREASIAAGETETAEYTEIIGELCEALSDASEHEEALEAFAAFEVRYSGERDTSFLTRKARILHRAGKPDEAMEVLYELKTAAEESGERDRILKIYDQILKLDPNRRDVSRALREIKLGRTKVMLLRLRLVGILAAFGALGYFLWDYMATQERIRLTAESIREEIKASKLDDAKSMISQAQIALGDNELWTQLGNEIKNKRDRLARDEKRRAEAAVSDELIKANDQLRKGAFQEALATVSKHLATPLGKRVFESQKKQIFRNLGEEIRDQQSKLGEELPAEPSDIMKLEEMLEARKILEQKLGLDIGASTQLLAHLQHPLIQQHTSEEQRNSLARDARQTVEVRAEVERLSLAYASRISKLRKNKRLDPVFKTAQMAEERFDFQTAETLYQQLYEEYRGNQALAPQFRDRVGKYAAINKFLNLLRTAARRSDFHAARAHYRHLKRSYADYPWARLVRLPLQVQTTPAGAKVVVNGKEVGRAPLTLLYHPADDTRVEIRLDGFQAEATQITGDRVGMVRSVMTRAPSWAFPPPGVVQQPPTCKGDTVFLADRSGNLSSWSVAGRKQLWVHKTRDLSGKLTRPMLFRNMVVIASLDGPLRAFDQDSGKPLWTLEGLPCETNPAVQGRFLALVTTKNELVLVDLVERKVTHRDELRAGVRADLAAYLKSVLYVDDRGLLHSYNVRKGQQDWAPRSLGGGLPSPIAIHEHNGVVGDDEGRLSVVDLRTGQIRWQRKDLGEIRHRPLIHEGMIYVSTAPTIKHPARLLAFELAKGDPGPRFEGVDGELWTTGAAAVGDRILLGTRSGIVHVLNRKDLSIAFRILGKGACSTRPIVTAQGLLLCTFEGPRVQVYPRLP